MEGVRVKVVAGSNRMLRKRRALFTDEEMAKECGCSPEEIRALEASFWTVLQTRYTNVIGYRLATYPAKKRVYVEADD